jgi:hypothetical protein
MLNLSAQRLPLEVVSSRACQALGRYCEVGALNASLWEPSAALARGLDFTAFRVAKCFGMVELDGIEPSTS